MKILFPVTVFVLIVLSCNNTGETKAVDTKAATEEKQKFFPVTSFLKGEIFNLKKNGINPLKYTTVNDRTDSAWLKIEEIDDAVKEFLYPEIDTANLTAFFSEKSFFDQTINAVTFTYEAAGVLPDSIKLVNWDVYVDPDANRVKRIYMVKQQDKDTLLQLTWVTGKWCKITTIVTDEKGSSTVKKEEKITWDF